MSSDWSPGDLALCIRDDWRRKRSGAPPPNAPRRGQIIPVKRVKIKTFRSGRTREMLVLSGLPGYGWRAEYFIKVTPTEADEFDREVIDIMSGRRAPFPIELGGPYMGHVNCRCTIVPRIQGDE